MSTLIKNGTVVTMDPDRTVYPDGAVVVSGSEIRTVGPAEELESAYDAEEVIDADGGLILPGFINAHVHVPDILYRGLSDERSLHDWLFNVKRPLVAAMTVKDHELATALYCQESLLAGITTFVENAGGTGTGYDPKIIETKMDCYDHLGVRNIYAHGFLDAKSDDQLSQYLDVQIDREPLINNVSGSLPETDEALDEVESLIEQYHGTAEGRQSVWPGPFLAWGVTPEGLAGAYDIAERHDVMTTTHTAESPAQERRIASSVEYLESAGYLGERTLLGHCVQLSEPDVRILAETNTNVAHNVVTNCMLGAGFAPVPTMRGYGVTVGLGTDNIDQNDTVNMISDMRFAATVHRAARQDSRAISAADVVAMATIEGAQAIGREDDLGSLESGKLADITILNTNSSHQLPYGDPLSMLVYQAQGTEVSTVLCNGQIVVDNGTLAVGDHLVPESAQTVWEHRAALLERTGHAERYPEDWSLQMVEY